MSLVHELLATGARLVWFTADIAHARRLFVQRGSIPVASFDAQIQAIQHAGLLHTLRCVTVQALTDAGTLKDPSEIFREVFGA